MKLLNSKKSRIIEKGQAPAKPEPRQREKLAIFNGLNEKEINTLYSMSTIRHLREGEVLAREGKINQNVYVVLKGRVRVIRDAKGRNKENTLLGKGSWIGDMVFGSRYPRCSSVIAVEPSNVMTLDMGTVKSLEERTQLFFYKKFLNLSALRMGQLDSEGQIARNKAMMLEDALFKNKTKAGLDYNKSSLINGIIQKVPKLPAFVSNLSSKLLEEEASIKDVAELIKEDPALVADVLKAVNSSYYGFQQKVSDLNSAVLFLGFKELYHLVISEGIRRSMPNTPGFRSLHSRAVAVSHIAFSISNISGKGVPVQLGTMGLLHNIGHTVIELLKKKNPNLAFFIGSMDQAYLGSLLLKKWNLPDIIWGSVAFQSYPEFAPPEKIPEQFLDSASIIYMAGICTDELTGVPYETIPTLFYEDYAKCLGWIDIPFNDVLKKRILPDLRKKKKVLPIFLRNLLG